MTNRTAFLIRRLMNDQNLADLKKAKMQNASLRSQVKLQKQGHLSCLTEIIKLYQEKSEQDPIYIEKLDKLLEKRD